MADEPKPASNPAFPVPSPFSARGMSLRAWLAGQVISSLTTLPRDAENADHRAEAAVMQADAVIRALEVKS